MTVAAFIERMRTKQEALYSSTVAVTRDGGPGAIDSATASYAAPTTTTIYTGAALVRPDSDHDVTTGETSVELSDFVVKLPVDTAVAIGDTVTVTASTYDTGLVGVTLRVLHVDADEWQIARVARCAAQTARPT